HQGNYQSIKRDRKLKACLENRKCTAKQMRNQWAETGVDVYNKMVHHKVPSYKVDLATAIRECWSRIDEEYCLSLVKSMPQRLQAVIKARSGATKY
uniref:Uncharacterized protein n=1 Tax=Gouania willdenowi TaxID=441366 RepID=A0A8C5EG28_GOUWI